MNYRRIDFIIYLSIPIIANLLAIASSFALNDFIFLPEERLRFFNFLKLVPWSLWLINVFPFTVSMLTVLYYIFPLLKEMIQFKIGKNLSEKSVRILLNSPLVISFIGMGGWILGTTLAVSLQIYFIRNATVRGILTTISNTFSIGGIAVVATYYGLDFFNRKKLIQYYIPNIRITKVKDVLKPSILIRFLIFFFSISFLPTTILTLMLIRTSLANNSTIPMTFILTPLTMMLIGSLLSYLLAIAFDKPLYDMKSAVLNIEKGLYDIKISTTSSDELGLLGESINEMAASLKEKEFMKETFGKVVDPAVRDYLLSGNIKLGGEICIATILFSDIRGFTALSEKLNPSQIVAMLNTYFETMSHCIVSEGGLINKYIGVAIMAIYNVPITREDHAIKAYQTASKMLDSLSYMNEDFSRKGLPNLKIGIGLHTGEVLAGNIGSSSRLEFTVIGDTVNVASRIESLCKETGKSLLLSNATATLLPKDILLENLGHFQLKGRKEGIEIFSGR